MENDSLKEYTGRGWSIFPCAPNNKTPLTPRGFHDSVKEYEPAQKLFAGRSGCNMAIATGKVSGFFVLDVDNHNGIDGSESLRDLEKQFGALPDTVECLTPSGGRHLYFKYPEGGIGNRTKVRPGLDVRGDAGYVVCPPSIINGNAYTWEAEHHPDTTTIADAPAWLLNIIRSAQVAAPASAAAAPEAEKYTEGQRNYKLMRRGVALRKMGLPYETIATALKELNRLHCVPPLSEKEVATIAQSVSKYEPEKKKPVDFSKEPYTDCWNASLFYQKSGSQIRYCDALGGWLVWDNTRWLLDSIFRITALAREAVKQMFDMAQEKEEKELFRHAERCEAENRLKSMINIVRSENGISRQSKEFDKDGYLLNWLNGTMDLRTGKMRAHSKEDYITKRVEYSYDPAAQCPAWEKFLDSVFLGDKELVRFIQKAVGYALSGSVEEQCIFFLYGTGSNGKSTFLKHLFNVFGDYAMSTPAATLMEKYDGAIPNDIARLKGARFVTCFESGEGKKLAESVIKTLTGGDKIAARFLHHEFFEFYPSFKIFLATNYKPQISGTDKGIWRRIRLIPFDKVITDEERDIDLDKKLAAEYPGILAWAVKGFSMWQAEGLRPTKRIKNGTEEYREESDIIGNFIKENCAVAPKNYCISSTLLKCFKEWCKDNGAGYVTRTRFFEYMESKGFKRERYTMGGAEHGKFCWSGIEPVYNDAEPGFTAIDLDKAEARPY